VGTGVGVPAASLSLNSLNFGSVSVGAVSNAQTIMVSNPGSLSLNVIGISAGGSNPNDFSVGSSCASALVINATCTISVLFTPSGAGLRTATLSLADSAPNSPQLISLSGTGLSRSSASASPANVTFTGQAVGTTSPAQTVTLSNSGNTTLNISSVSMAGLNATDFQLVNNCPATLALATSCSVSVAFVPSGKGSRTAILNFADSGTNSPQTIALAGTGLSVPPLTLSSTAVNYGLLPLGASATQQITVSNPSTGSSQTITTALNGSYASQFVITENSCAASLGPGNSCSLTIQFAPVLAGSLDASVSVSGSGGNGPLSANLSGVGVRPFAFHAANRYLAVVFRPWDASWWIENGPPSGYQFGVLGDIPVTGDFDGDHNDDLAVFRPSTGCWWVRLSGNSGAVTSRQWGQQGDIPVPGDYDGDGKADFAVWRPSTGDWLISPSGNPGTPISQQWGAIGDIPVPGDYDGDGKTDIAIWRPSTGDWWIIPSSNPNAVLSFHCGFSGGIPVPADYDGDGRADAAVWQPTTGLWSILLSGDPGSSISECLGNPGDVPVPGDYQGTGKAALNIWRPLVGYWSDGPVRSFFGMQTLLQQWSLAGEIP